ncbi:MAG: metalloregulator ArsR/SmtB family transcription factor [Methanocellales archaeon]|nr:metalloregulator ArsR/SmtB family transcription factor [Methanocellales archaeon]MDD3291758.1 metalloregulator ArsR/SmtB family transcription factor [Methanocellales archaeon]MDD5235108.1 metalloregulator ArsR/SmtB family transcription factor [Methanocellales archaeon]MDD5485246.1 metalloregulator ArsR/SmtB family transcription factor [Methanocellales archaeon]
MIRQYVISPETLEKVKASVEEDIRDVTSILQILSYPIRLHILRALGVKDLCVCVLVEITGHQHSALSYHLKKLTGADLINSKRDGNFLIYHLTDKGKKVLKSLEHMK